MIIDEQIENKEIAKQYKELLRISYLQLTDEDKKLIRLAFDTAVDAHKYQRRKSGEAYIFHPIAVAKIVASEIGLDAASIAACWAGTFGAKKLARRSSGVVGISKTHD